MYTNRKLIGHREQGVIMGLVMMNQLVNSLWPQARKSTSFRSLAGINADSADKAYMFQSVAHQITLPINVTYIYSCMT